MKIESIVRLGRRVLTAAVLISVFGSLPALTHELRDPRRIEIAVTENGFEPNRIPVLQHEEVTLAFTRKSNRACKDVTIQYDRRVPKERIEITIEFDKPSVLTMRFASRGTHKLACAQGRKTGVFLVH